MRKKNSLWCRCLRYYSSLSVNLKHKDQSGSDPSKYATLLINCTNSRNLARGKLAHAELIERGHGADAHLANLAVQMYARCGSLEDAVSVFETECSVWDVCSWNAVIAVNAQKGHLDRALHLFWRMDQEGVRGNKWTFVTVLGLCSGLGAKGLSYGAQVHSRLLQQQTEMDGFVSNTLIKMYAKCGSIHEAKVVFDQMQIKDVISWNSMISAYAQTGHGKEALDLFHRLEKQGNGLQPDVVTYVCILGACSSTGNLAEGRRIHQIVSGSATLETEQLKNTLVHMYAKCGSLQEARQVFDQLKVKHIITWSIVMSLYTHRGDTQEAMKLLRSMELEGAKPDGVALTKLLEACGKSGDLAQGRLVHARVRSSGFDSDPVVATAVVTMYSKCGDLQAAEQAFGRIPVNVVSWNALIAGYTQHGHSRKAVEMYRRMEPEGMKPSEVTYIHVLGACSNLKDLEEGRMVHARVKADGFDTHSFIGNALVNLYSKCNRLDCAREAFERIAIKDVVSWNSMIGTYAQLGHSREALELFWRMEPEGMEPTRITYVHALGACLSLFSAREAREIHEKISHTDLDRDLLVGSALVNVYGKCGYLEEARNVFDKMNSRNVVPWSAMIAALAEHSRGKDALLMFQLMDLDGTKPNEVTLLSVLEACAATGAIAEGRRTHHRILRVGLYSDIIENSLINMYGKCGHLYDARAVFDSMKRRDVVSWTGMLAGYSHHGYRAETMLLFKEMALDGTQPNMITFVSVLFNCSHAGVVKDGLEQFHSMVGDFGIFPVVEHYSCMIDLLGRAGWLEQAEELMHTMPMEPDPAAWNSLLGACKVHSHTDRAIRIAKEACQRGLALASAPYVLLSNIYATKGAQAEKSETLNSESSLIEVKGRIHEFVSRKLSHPRMEEIHAELQRLHGIITESQRVPEANQFGSLATEDPHNLIAAIAYGLIAAPSGVPLNIVNNQKICLHCHAAAKLISRAVDCKIVVRDPIMFHHFHQGVCSCGDYC